MSINDIIDIKQKNVKDIIRCVRFNDGLTKKQIAEKTGLSFSTVSNICNELKEKGVITDKNDGNYSVGRTPKVINLAYNKFFVLCLDLQLEGIIKMALLDLRNNIIFQYENDNVDFADVYELVNFAYSGFQTYIKSHDISEDHIVGVGVAISGVFDRKEGKIGSCMVPILEGQPLKKIISDVFHLPVYVDNESNLSVLAAQLYKAKDDYKDNVIYLYIGEGVGVGVISDGTLIRGENGYGTEIGHIPIGNMNYQCRTCHSYGCVETDLSIYGFVKKYTGRFMGRKEGVVKEWNNFICDVLDNKPEAMNVIQENGIILGQLVSILVNLFDPALIYMGGVIAPIYDKLYPFIIDEVKKRLLIPNDREIMIECDENSDYTIFKGSVERLLNMWDPLFAIT
ncbi:ROK family transcriptional regulator [Mahella australiensis]|uniref:ROK family protein n=1 Tax=Mahella australiensis (strain DSM 15567 / CIP 107919 / 50-1 BON) TaxID=697281 RepID=F3ZZQ4_MAHA5|nr:ROK family transcriptional regulator [Mahella australiensis]AEE97901.1 ROK family protein [Mahella australiensis 50-1 BON]